MRSAKEASPSSIIAGHIWPGRRSEGKRSKESFQPEAKLNDMGARNPTQSKGRKSAILGRATPRGKKIETKGGWGE